MVAVTTTSLPLSSNSPVVSAEPLVEMRMSMLAAMSILNASTSSAGWILPVARVSSGNTVDAPGVSPWSSPARTMRAVIL